MLFIRTVSALVPSVFAAAPSPPHPQRNAASATRPKGRREFLSEFVVDIVASVACDRAGVLSENWGLSPVSILSLLDRVSFRRDGRRVEVNRFARCEKLLERPLVHPYVAFQARLEPPNGQASCCLIHRYSNVGSHLHSPNSIVSTPGLPPAHANVHLHAHQLSFARGPGLLSLPLHCSGIVTPGRGGRRAGSRSGDPSKGALNFTLLFTFPCYSSCSVSDMAPLAAPGRFPFRTSNFGRCSTLPPRPSSSSAGRAAWWR